jgi:hypothetical protein
MKNVSLRKLSLLGLVLMAASAVTAAILPKNEPKKIGPGQLADSAAAGVSGQKTCVQNSDLNQCTFTASGTTEVGDSSGNTDTGGTLNSSQSPN